MATTTAAPQNPGAVSMSSVSISLAQLEVPKPVYNRGGQYVLLGKNHEFMPKVLALLRKSPTASAVLNRKTALVAGDGFKVDGVKLPGLVTFLKNVGSSGRHRTGNKLLQRVAKDFTRLRGFAIQVVWAVDGVHIAELYHQRFETVAPGPLNDEDEVETYFTCRDWSKRGQYKIKDFPAYNPAKAKEEPVQLYVYQEEEPGVEYFPALDYEAGLPYIELEADLAIFHSTNVAAGFKADTVISIRQGPVDRTDEKTGNPISAASQRDTLEKAFAKKYTGPAAPSYIFLWGDGSADDVDKMAQITSLSKTGSQGLYTTYAELAQQAILSAFSCTSPMVAGLPAANGGALGGNGQELYQSFKLFFNTVCQPDQHQLRDAFKELFSHVVDVDFTGEPEKEKWLDITGTLPVEYTFSEQLMELIMTDDELRAKISLDPLPAGTKTAAEPDSAPAPTPALPAPAPPATQLSQVESILLLLSKNEKLATLVLDSKPLQEALFGVAS